MTRTKAISGFFASLLLFGALSEATGATKKFADATREGTDFFERRIRPILTERCFECHSRDAKKIKGGLLLDSRTGLMKGGDNGAVIVPGEPDQSRLIRAIRYSDPELQMPPKTMLSPKQISDFEAWVRMGAPDPRLERRTAQARLAGPTNHWAFQPIRGPVIPKVKERKWPKSPIDYFILARLEKENLSPVAPADRRTLIRRATFDLTGLPPKPEEIDAFLADSSAEAFAKVVDRLLDSPQFGERWGRHWLDVARYADSNGLETNLPFENAWRYRDYVVKSFNQDKPFDRFIREQIAGDLLPGRDQAEQYDHLIATGFLVLGPKALFEPNQNKQLMDVADEQIDVTTRAFLALTVSCARCHDHKFDPVPARDYYALAGIFKSTKTLAAATRGDPGGPRWLERPLAPPEKFKLVEDHAAAVAKVQEAMRKAGETKMAFPGGIDSTKLTGIVVDNTAAQLTGAWKESSYSTNFVNGNYIQDGNTGKGQKTARFAPNLPKAGLYEVLFGYPPRSNRATNVPVTIEFAMGSRTIALDETKTPEVMEAFTSLGTFRFAAGTNGAVVISNAGTKGFVVADAVQFVSVAESQMKMNAMAAEKGQATNAAKVSDKTALIAANLKLGSTPGAPMAEPNYETLAEELSDLLAKRPPPVDMTMAVKEGDAANCRINLRGDPDKLGDEVPRGFLTAVSTKSVPRIQENASGRLELADWIASPENPLTARVAVNRIWLHLFGKGLVDTPDNFGALSEAPSHPEMLDHLAKQFVDQGWSFKKTIRSIMLSSPYQMSSDHDAKAYAKDPDNKWIWRMNRRRLEAEAIRDAMLAVSGQLDLAGGGPPLATNAMAINRPVMANTQVENNRRSLYLPIIRNNVPEMFQLFDLADPHVISGKRHSTTAPPQALFMMNNPFVIEQARQWAEALLTKAAATDAERVKTAYLSAFGRSPTTPEAERAGRFLDTYARNLRKTEPDTEKRRQAAWQSFCQALLASSEFRFLN